MSDWADAYRDEARRERGYRTPPAPRRRPTAATSRILDQLSPDSRSTLTYRQQPGGDLAAPANPGASAQRQHAEYLEEATRANPYSEFNGDVRSERYERPAGFDGYYGETEFLDPFTGETVYYAGDAKKILTPMDSAVLARLQEQLTDLGFLSGTFAPGAADQLTEKAFADLLSEAHRRGNTWETTLRQLEKLHEELGYDEDDEEKRTPFVAPAYLAPDYASLAQDVKSQMRDALGRDPDDSEMAQLVSEFEGWYKERYEEEVAALESTYDAEGRAMEGEEGQAGGTFTEIDPMARFKESFERRFSSERAGMEAEEEAAETSDIVGGAVSTISQLSGGRG